MSVRKSAGSPVARPESADPLQKTMLRLAFSSEQEWIEHGQMLGRAERVLGWAIAAWWNAGEKYGRRVEIVQGPGWAGPSYKTCRNYAAVAAAYATQGPLSLDGDGKVSRQRGALPFTHYAEVAFLPPPERQKILSWAEAEASRGELPPARVLRQMAKRERREERERELGGAIAEFNEGTATAKRYGVILADPPWRFEPWSRNTGMDRAADNHYPTMTIDRLMEIELPAADHCVLFLWRTAPMIEPAVELVRRWGFKCVSEIIWAKNRLGTGYWTRNRHEVLMVCRRGDVVSPAAGEQPESLYSFPVGPHSAKPPEFHRLIETMFPHTPRLEMFARARRAGWDQLGAELAEAAD